MKLKLTHSELKELNYYLVEVVNHIQNKKTQYNNELTLKNKLYINAQIEFVTDLSKQIAKKLIDLKTSYTINLLQIQALTLINYFEHIKLNNTYTLTIILEITENLNKQLVNNN